MFRVSGIGCLEGVESGVRTVRALGSLSRWHDQSLCFCLAHGPRPLPGGAFASARHREWPPSLVGMCKSLYEHREWLLMYVRHQRIEPTNNAGKRPLRHAVIWRKLSLGAQSTNGSLFVQTILTFIEACRQQWRNAPENLTLTVEATSACRTLPSLLPRV